MVKNISIFFTIIRSRLNRDQSKTGIYSFFFKVPVIEGLTLFNQECINKDTAPLPQIHFSTFMKYFLGFIVFIFLVALLAQPHTILAVPFGNYLQMLGGYLEADSNNSSVPTSFVFEGWVNPLTTQDYQPIISIGTTQHSYEIGINGGSLSVDLRYGTNSRKVITTSSVDSGVWSKLAVSIDSSSILLFLNDIQVFSGSGASPLRPVGDTVRLGKSVNSSFNETFNGNLDEVSILVNGVPFILWNLDESRGITIAQDASANNFDAVLVGGDSKIHFFGILTTATPRPTLGIRWNRPILPTLSFSSWFPTQPSQPTSSQPQPTGAQLPTPTGDLHDPFNRPVYPRRYSL